MTALQAVDLNIKDSGSVARRPEFEYLTHHQTWAKGTRYLISLELHLIKSITHILGEL